MLRVMGEVCGGCRDERLVSQNQGKVTWQRKGTGGHDIALALGPQWGLE